MNAHDDVLPFLAAGVWTTGESGDVLKVEDPSSSETYRQVAVASSEDIHRAVTAARSAQQSWGRVPAGDRAALLDRLAALLERDAERLARIVVAELGKPVTQAREEVQAAVAYARYFAALAVTQGGEMMPSSAPNRELWLRREPLGVVAAISPWNFPLALVLRKLAPALAAGNAIVLKPSELTPVSALAVAELTVEAGFPPGLVSVLPGTGSAVGAVLVRAPGVDFVTMTGGGAAGRAILADAAPRIIPVSLELGGKAPFIVFEDADLDRAVRDAVATRMINGGQSCISNERTYVHRDLYDEFVSRYVAATQALIVGDPSDEATQVGPLVSAREQGRVHELVREAVDGGAAVSTGGGPAEAPAGLYGGHWYLPTVLTDFRQDVRLLREEVFGPVTPILRFEDEREVIQLANDSDYGLSSYVYTEDFSRIMRMTHALQFAEVFVNRPGSEEMNGFHAGWGQSGLGGDDGLHGFALYSRWRSIYLRWNDEQAH